MMEQKIKAPSSCRSWRPKLKSRKLRAQILAQNRRSLQARMMGASHHPEEECRTSSTRARVPGAVRFYSRT